MDKRKGKGKGWTLSGSWIVKNASRRQGRAKRQKKQGRK